MTAPLFVIVVAAGASARMGGVDKTFAELAGRPLVAHCLEAVHGSPLVRSVILVLAGHSVERGRTLVADRRLDRVTAVVAGGKRRQDSVRIGLEALPDGAEWVAVHDGARPFVDEAMLQRGLDAAAATGAAVAAVPVTDTIKTVDDRRLVTGTLDRAMLWAVQTPQIFRRDLLLEAHRTVLDDVTDDASMVERVGGRVSVFEGSSRNIKITTAEDLVLAELLAGGRSGPAPSGSRWGTGFDAHRLMPERELRLGGITVPFDQGLKGHSDGDVLLHAIADALLGAAGLGDLGRHFPSADPAWKGIDSRELVRRVSAMLAEAGWAVDHVDSTVIAQRPVLAPYLDGMASSIAGTLAVPTGAVSVKATTTDHVGAVGQGEGIAAQAIATISPRS